MGPGRQWNGTESDHLPILLSLSLPFPQAHPLPVPHRSLYPFKCSLITDQVFSLWSHQVETKSLTDNLNSATSSLTAISAYNSIIDSLVQFLCISCPSQTPRDKHSSWFDSDCWSLKEQITAIPFNSSTTHSITFKIVFSFVQGRPCLVR